MNSFQESKNELEAAIRYAENAISAAQTTIESMQFRQDMAKKEYEERTGREEALQREVAELKTQLVEERNRSMGYTDELEKLRKEKEASSGACGCQAYRDLEEFNAELSMQNVSLAEGKPTMPVIPKDVAIAIFREGIKQGVADACNELEGQTINICENEYCGDFSVSFERDIDLDDHLDLDWVRDKVGSYEKESVEPNLKGLCENLNFECRIHGVDDAD